MFFLAKGDIIPARGQPGWASTVLLLDPQGLPQDASAYDGIVLRVRLNKGNLSISANSSEITNFDYHAAPLICPSDGEFHEVKIPFSKCSELGLNNSAKHQDPDGPQYSRR